MKTQDPFNLQRFLDAQKNDYADALHEIKQGYKQSHWIWFIFPQMRGLGMSYMAEYYGISSIEEARAYLDHPTLRARLLEISTALLKHKGKSTAYEILGTIDAIKVRSSMTLFDHIMPHAIFAKVLDAFYNSQRDEKTTQMIQS
ncbi:MAG: DUF1810 domain-containing protein [Paludibacteraceae bacterium]|nr:DUF1810 domain-containing protein [Paludibacteraceae bacterium]